jgi:glutamate carboxypeptidase
VDPPETHGHHGSPPPRRHGRRFPPFGRVKGPGPGRGRSQRPATLQHAALCDPGLVARLTNLLPGMLDDLARLVECESPSADLTAVARSAEVVAGLGRRLTGQPPERIVVNGCTHLRWEFGDCPRRVLVVGHHDTVWPAGSLKEHPWSVTGGVVRGPGCLDMKAGLVQMFHALSVIGDLDGLTVLVTGDEEIGSPTSAALVEETARRSAAALVVEMAADGGALKTARKGMSLYEVTVIGRAAHPGLNPERGINASVEAAHQVLAVTALADAAMGTTVTPTVMQAGTAANVVPARASFAVDVRVATVMEQLRMDEAMSDLQPALPGAAVSVSRGPRCPPMEPASSQALFAHAQCVAARLGLEPLRGVLVGGASDGNRTAGAGTSTLDGLGAVGGGAHASEEHVLVESMPGRAALLAGLLVELLGELRSQDAASLQNPAG